MAETPEDRGRVAAPSDWQGWLRWVEGVDWSDWRSWLQRVMSTDWGSGQTVGAPWQEAAQAGPVSLTVRAYAEDQPGERVREQLAATWPAFRRWWRDGANTRPAAGEARARLEEHMPELVPTWERLTGMIPGDSDAGAALALWNPPPFLTGCSQAVVLDGGPALIRTVERAQLLEELLADGTDVPGIIAACLRPPLYATHFHEGFGTLYTAEYRPIDGVARYHWPGRTWEHSLDKVESQSIQLQLGIP